MIYFHLEHKKKVFHRIGILEWVKNILIKSKNTKNLWNNQRKIVNSSWGSLLQNQFHNVHLLRANHIIDQKVNLEVNRRFLLKNL